MKVRIKQNMKKTVKQVKDQKKLRPAAATANAAPAAASSPAPSVQVPLLSDKQPSKWKLLWREYRYLGFAFLIPIVLMYLLYVSMDVHPFGNGSVLVLDLNGQYVYFYEALRAWIYGDGSLLYSFGRSLGGEFMGIYAYYIASPFSYLVALFPKNRMLEALLTIFLLKSGVCGATFGFYLHKTAPKVNKLSVVTFSIMYAMCAYCVVQQHNSMWIDAVLWLPLLTYGIEELIKKGHFRLFVVSLAVTMMSNFYIGYMVCLYTLVYFFYYYFKTAEKHINNPYREKNHFLKSFLRIGLYAVIALGVAAVIWLSAYYALTFGKDEFTNPSWTFKTKFTLLEFFTKFLPGSFDTVRPEGLPFVYCGTMILFLVPIYFLSKKFTIRDKIFSVALIGFFFVSFCLNPLDLIWHGFQNPNWLNYRYSFMLCFTLLVMAYKAFCEMRAVKPQWIFAIGTVIAVLIVLAEQFDYTSYVKAEGVLDSFQIIWFSLIAVIVYTVMLYLVRIHRNKQAKLRSVSFILLFVVCIELVLNGISNVYALDRDVVYSSYSSYNTFLTEIRPIVGELQELDTSFYRSEKTDVRKTNDNMGLNMRGLSNSTSTLNLSTIEFLKQMGYASSSHWSKYMGGNLVNDSLLGVKYIIDANQHIHETELYYNRELLETYCEKILEDEYYTAYYNPYSLSLVYGVDDDINALDLTEYFNPYDRMNDMITAMLGAEETIEVFVPVEDVNVSTRNCETSSIAKHEKYVPEVTSRDAVVNYDLVCEEDCTLYFYLPSEYPREVGMKVNSVDYGTFYGNETSRSRLIGNYEAGDNVLISLTLKKDNLYVKKNVPVVYKLDWAVLESCMEQLAQTQMVIDAEYSETYLPGTLTTTKDDQMMLMTVPYDKGWIITVDGERVETYETMDALTAFYVDHAGEHDVVLRYRPDTFVYGMALTVSCSVIFLLLCALLWFMKKKQKRFFLVTGVPIREDFDEEEEDSKLCPEDIADEAARLAEAETAETEQKDSSDEGKSE